MDLASQLRQGLQADSGLRNELHVSVLPLAVLANTDVDASRIPMTSVRIRQMEADIETINLPVHFP